MNYRSLPLRRIFLLLALTSASASWGRPTSYRSMISLLKMADESGRVRVIDAGRSGEGRSIPLVIIGSPNASYRVMILCRQHGNEPTSTEASLSLIRKIAAGNSSILQSVQGVRLFIFPMVNPDGAERFTRNNGLGADLNRDWIAQSQPETRAVLRAYRRFRPQTVIDAHEWNVTDPILGYTSLDADYNASAVTLSLQQSIAMSASAEAGIRLPETLSRREYDRRLAHRYFASLGAHAYLLESKSNSVPFDRRESLYERVFLDACRASKRILDPSPYPSLASRRILSMKLRRSLSAAASSNRSYWLLIGAYGAILLSVSLFGRAGSTALSAERHSRRIRRRCSISDMSDLSLRLEHRRPQRPSTNKKTSLGAEPTPRLPISKLSA